MTAHLFLDAEIDYRLERAAQSFPRGRRHRVRRRHTLPLPSVPRRPVAVA